MAIERRRPTLDEIKQSQQYQSLVGTLSNGYQIGPEEITPVLDGVIFNLLDGSVFDHLYSIAENDARAKLNEIKMRKPYSNQE